MIEFESEVKFSLFSKSILLTSQLKFLQFKVYKIRTYGSDKFPNVVVVANIDDFLTFPACF